MDIGADGVIARLAGFGITDAAGPVVPADGHDGYAPGCIFRHVDGATSSTVLYVNVGTVLAANFDSVDPSGFDGTGTFDVISELTPDAGVTLDGAEGILHKDNQIFFVAGTQGSVRTDDSNLRLFSAQSTVSIESVASGIMFSATAITDFTATEAGGALFAETKDGGTADPDAVGLAGGNFTLTAGVGSAGGEHTAENPAGGDSGSISFVTQAGGAAGAGGSGAAGLDGVIRLISAPGVIFRKQAAPTTATTAATLTAAQLLSGLLVATPTAGATAYQLPTGETLDDAIHAAVDADEGFEFTILNLGADADDIITVTTHTGWTALVGAMTVPSAHSSTGAVYGSSARFFARKTAADTWTLYRLA